MARRRAGAGQGTLGEQAELPIQPVENPILNSPYREPMLCWEFDRERREFFKQEGRRPARYWYKTREQGRGQQLLELDEGEDELVLVNGLRADVRRWRESGWRGATEITKQLLKHWWREDRPRRLFFCQLEAVETVIFLSEIRAEEAGGRRRRPNFAPQFTDADFAQLTDVPNEAEYGPLTRYGCKMATGSGKTVVMAMLIAWAFCNRGRVPSDERFARAALVCCPNLTVKERLQVLRPEEAGNYYAAFDLVPATLRPLLQSGKVLVTNWHAFAPESEHVEGGKSWAVVEKGPESDEAFARRVLGELYERGPLMVLNDEAHHAYRPKQSDERLIGEEARLAKEDRLEATIWISGLDRVNAACGVRQCVDLSATPFYIAGSGYEEGSPFPWLVSDFGLVDAIESGIVKIPRLPVNDTTGRPEAKYFRLWQNIVRSLPPGEFLPGGARKPRPEAVWREAQAALNTLAGQWKERLEYIEGAGEGKARVPPVLILVCDNTDIAEVFFRAISGEEQTEEAAASEEDEEEDGESPRSRTARKRTVYGTGQVFPDSLSNAPGVRRTVRIDTKLLAQAESEDPKASREAAAQEMRKLIATVGKAGEPGEQIRCVVSVSMLTEGWDANNVTHILGLRAFGSQLLCEQVVGRGLRRMDYTPDPETGLLHPEYVDVYGIPFTLIPFKGRPTQQKAPEDKPINHVRALPERKRYEMQFPVVDGYVFALRQNAIKADVKKMERLRIEPDREPTAVFVKAAAGYQEGRLSTRGPGEFERQDRDAFYASTHRQTIEFQIAQQVVSALVGDAERSPDPRGNPQLRKQSRHQLFPQVLRVVHEYVERKVDSRGEDLRELGHQRYIQQIVGLLLAAIEPDDAAGEPPLMPLLNRYKPIGTTAEVNFKTIRQCHPTGKSHINQIAVDTATWESSAAFRLEMAQDVVSFYARNEQLGLMIPYDFLQVSHSYEPDFLVRLANGVTVLLEIKGFLTEQDKAKHEAARKWVRAVNNWSRLGQWEFHVCHDPQMLERELRLLLIRSQ